jgi:hypothetical protein
LKKEKKVGKMINSLARNAKITPIKAKSSISAANAIWGVWSIALKLPEVVCSP